MRKVRICAPNIWVNSNENLGFVPQVIDHMLQIAHPIFNKFSRPWLPLESCIFCENSIDHGKATVKVSLEYHLVAELDQLNLIKINLSIKYFTENSISISNCVTPHDNQTTCGKTTLKVGLGSRPSVM